jgi:phosphonate transport system substrate-binding protein
MIGREYIVTSIVVLLLVGIMFYMYPPEIGGDVVVVDLNEVAGIAVRRTPSSGDVVYFGFDLRLGPKTDVETYAPLMEYLSAKTGKQFKLRYAETYEETQYYLGSGLVSFAAIGPVSYVSAVLKYGNVIPFLVGLDSSRSTTYRAVIFTSPASDITRIEDIKSRSFAFGSFYSTQGHLIPRIMLEKAGIKIGDLNKYAYLGSHQACAQAVIAGLFDAGGMQDTLAFRLESEGLVRIIAVSEPYPRSMIAANRNVDPELLEKVKSSLVELDPLGKDAKLLNWSMTEFPGGFAEVKPEYYNIYFELFERFIQGEGL